MERWLKRMMVFLSFVGALSLYIQGTGEVLVFCFLIVAALLVYYVVQQFRNLSPINVWEEEVAYGDADIEICCSGDSSLGTSLDSWMAPGIPKCACSHSC